MDHRRRRLRDERAREMNRQRAGRRKSGVRSSSLFRTGKLHQSTSTCQRPPEGSTCQSCICSSFSFCCPPTPFVCRTSSPLRFVPVHRALNINHLPSFGSHHPSSPIFHPSPPSHVIVIPCASAQGVESFPLHISLDHLFSQYIHFIYSLPLTDRHFGHPVNVYVYMCITYII